jgi:hypothetical protein
VLNAKEKKNAALQSSDAHGQRRARSGDPLRIERRRYDNIHNRGQPQKQGIGFHRLYRRRCLGYARRNQRRYLQKGVLVLIEGRLKLRPYQSKGGEKHKAAEVVMSLLQILGRKTDDGDHDASEVTPAKRL